MVCFKSAAYGVKGSIVWVQSLIQQLEQLSLKNETAYLLAEEDKPDAAMHNTYFHKNAKYL